MLLIWVAVTDVDTAGELAGASDRYAHYHRGRFQPHNDMTGELARLINGNQPVGGDKRMPTFTEAMGLVDLWREEHPNARQYSYVSNTVGSMSRPDYVLSLRRRLTVP